MLGGLLPEKCEYENQYTHLICLRLLVPFLRALLVFIVVSAVCVVLAQILTMIASVDMMG